MLQGISLFRHQALRGTASRARLNRMASTSSQTNGDVYSNGVTARAPRPVRRQSTSPYPLTAVQPSRSIPRFPLLHYESPEAEAFAESSRDGQLLAHAKQQFEQCRPVVAIKFDAPRTSAYQRHAILKNHVLQLHKFRSLLFDANDPIKRTILLNVKAFEDLPEDARAFLKEEEAKGQLAITSDTVRVGYEYWGTEDVLATLLPEGLPEGTPTAFTTTGHIAHVNLREEHRPYRYIIGQVLLDKNSNVITTVVNKLDTIDTQFRFFAMERLAGEDNYTVTVSESGCKFTFDFRTVYWNSRLHTEHARLIQQFRPYEVICDVMAGVGPFAVPAAKKGCYVMANDLNPASYESLRQNSQKNHVQSRLQASCVDGAEYIKQSVVQCWNGPFAGEPLDKAARASDLDTSSKQRAKEAHQRALQSDGKGVQDDVERAPSRRLVDHFVMNLPATAIEFLGAYRGAYLPIAGNDLEEELSRRQASAQNEAVWPLVHVHCFTKDLEHPHEDIIRRANQALNIGPDSPHRLQPPSAESVGELSIHLVRSVAPNKDMYCLTFPLSRALLFSTDTL